MFNHAKGRVPTPKTVLLVAILLFFTWLQLNLYRQFCAENIALAQQIQSRQSAMLTADRSFKSHQVSQTLMAEISEAQSQIKTPWLPMLHDIERAQQANLYWMQLVPDAKRKHISMTVLAPQRQQGWGLVARLKKQASLTAVKLNASESTNVNGIPMTTLHLEAGWKF